MKRVNGVDGNFSMKKKSKFLLEVSRNGAWDNWDEVPASSKSINSWSS